MNIDVVWYAADPNHPPRGQWDLADLVAMTSGDRPSPLNGYTFTHHDGIATLPAGNGAIVVIPGQWHNGPEQVQQIRWDLGRLPWAVMMLVGDECSIFPHAELADHPRQALWVMTPRSDLHTGLDARFIGEGRPPRTNELLGKLRALNDRTGTALGLDLDARPLDAWFSGQDTHERRHELLAVMAEHGWEGLPSRGFAKGLGHVPYLGRLLDTKVAPCPSGVCTQDSFRLYEALEAGCVPVVEVKAPTQRRRRVQADHEFWPLMHGIDPDSADPPFPIVEDWNELPTIVGDVITTWPAMANRAGMWWEQRKRAMDLDLRADLRRVAGAPTLAIPDEAITVLIPSSPIGEHPDTEIIERCVASIREQLPAAEILVMVDGVPPELEHLRQPYEEHQERLLNLCRHRWEGVTPLRFDTHHHQAAMTVDALDQVITPLLLFVEHDWVLTGQIDWAGIADVLLADEADLVRLSWEPYVIEPHRHLYEDPDHPVEIAGVPLVRTQQWSQRPHVATVAYYRRILANVGQSRTMIEDLMHGVVSHAWRERGKRAWASHRLTLYSPPGDIGRVDHLDGRKGGAVVEGFYAYDGPAPAGAPRETSLT